MANPSTTLSHAPTGAKEASGAIVQLIVFKLGGQEYALRIDQVKEVVATPHISAVPLTESYIRGVANVRGNILAIIDLEERFGLLKHTTETQRAEPFTLVVESEEVKMGILSREVPNTLSVSEASIDDSPNLIKDNTAGKDYIKGIVKQGERLIILVDIMKVISKDEVGLALAT